IIILDPVQTYSRASQTNNEKTNDVQTHSRASQTNNETTNDVQTHSRASQTNDETTNDEKTHVRASLRFIRKPKSISSFIAGFKSASTNKIDDFIDERELPIKKFNRNHKFWHPNYHDHIIRNEEAYLKIKNYIINNPAKWSGDKFH